jgi:coenzyme F420 biosynthesis associated uncharacterized protein
MPEAPVPEAVDWALAARVGRAVAGPGPRATPEERARINSEFGALVAEADTLVRDFTGLHPAEPAGEPHVLGRGAWIDANIEGFRGLMSPVAKRLAEGPLRTGASRRVGRAALGLQIGLLLGYVSQKVLGQYDLLLAGGGAGRVYFVGPNVLAAERRWRFDPRDFRLWITLHEVTHRTQFVAVDWLKDHVQSLIDRYLSEVTFDAGRVRAMISEGVRLLGQGPAVWRKANLMEIFLSPGQREVLWDMQSLMTVVEGHGNFVMDRLGAEHIPTFERMKSSLSAQRSSAGVAERAVQRAIGLEMKYAQYSVGETFIAGVADRGGMSAVNRVWAKPENIPTTDELTDPDAWMRRVGVELP